MKPRHSNPIVDDAQAILRERAARRAERAMLGGDLDWSEYLYGEPAGDDETMAKEPRRG